MKRNDRRTNRRRRGRKRKIRKKGKGGDEAGGEQEERVMFIERTRSHLPSGSQILFLPVEIADFPTKVSQSYKYFSIYI